MASGAKIVWPIPDLINEPRIDWGGQASIDLGGSPSPVFCCQSLLLAELRGKGAPLNPASTGNYRRPPSLRQVGGQEPKAIRIARVRAWRAAAGPGPGYRS
jgi:hypothetical protein